ncbi:unnamed protein product [Acanthoscelides obtectus]|uniref:Peptidase S1 domain-containing protein n=1 Tax=Acanthoscelides obtectus TaxID=200917 RepID=A0A9P0KDD6_ACAOB|nr:unnamed protein product [Acanthoscelides obtectus]CAK1645389.1 Kallikrein-13 [Acanthoscelides obtectus]
MDSRCSVMGWGAISFSYAGSKSKAIRCALLEVAPSKDCSKVYKGMSESIVCIHTNTSAACGVDAGGPLVCQNVLYGIASYSGACERGVPGVYARVDTYLAFIIPHILREADSNVLHQAISVIVLACVHIALFLYSVVIWFPYTRFTFDNKYMN